MSKMYPVYRDHKGVFPLSELSSWVAKEYGDQVALRHWNGSGHDEITYKEMNEKVQALAKWIVNYGIKPGDRVAILGENSPHWAISYLATQTAGATAVPVDRLLPVSGIRHILSDSETRLLFTFGKYAEMLSEAEPPTSLEKTVSFDHCDCGDELMWSICVEEGKELEAELPSRSLDDLAALLYTSGTTGHSKGVMLTHKNLASNMAACYQCLPLGPGDNFLSVLPVHHSFEGTAGFLFPLYTGCEITYARSLKSNELLEDIKNTNVTIMLGVPLLYEKMHAGILRSVKKKGKEKLVNTLLSIVKIGEKFGGRWGVKLFGSLREKAGLGTVVYFISGGGPLDPAASEFFNRLGIFMLQGFGLTETSPVTHLTPPKKIRHECVGMLLPFLEAKIDNANEEGVGELLVRGDSVFGGYYQNDEATKEVIDSEGWFHTGDLGIIYDDGFLQITGRQKNLLVTGGGKNVYPEEIEYLLNRSDYIAESVVLGKERKKGLGDEVAALIYPDYEQVDIYFEGQDKKATPEDVNDLIKTEIKEAQKELADYKHIHHFRIMEEEFQKTSTRKVKRYLYSSEMLTVNGQKV